MASILSLNDDCLRLILYFLDDPGSFYNVVLTCKRFLKVIKSTKNGVHPSILRTKAEYYLKHHLVELAFPNCNGHVETREKRIDGRFRFSDLHTVVCSAVQLTEANDLLSSPRIIDVWQKNGPVVSKLLTWMRNQETKQERKRPLVTSTTTERCATFYLPRCEKELIINTSYIFDYGKRFDPKVQVAVKCGDLNLSSGSSSKKSIENHLAWEDEEVRKAVEPMRPVITLLQNELGKTIPSITHQFFLWFCYFFPDKGNLPEDHRLIFSDPGRNIKPSPSTVQAAVDLFHQNLQAEAKVQKLLHGWQNCHQEESPYSMMIVETINLLACRRQPLLLKSIECNIDRLFHVAWVMGAAPKQLLLDAILRTTVEKSMFTPGKIAENVVENIVFFKCAGYTKAMRVHGHMYGRDEGWSSWHKLQLDFALPTGEAIHLDTGYIPEHNRGTQTLAVKQLSPVTQLIQKGINLRMANGKKPIPRVNDIFTAAYFMHSLEFSNAITTFLGSCNYAKSM